MSKSPKNRQISLSGDKDVAVTNGEVLRSKTSWYKIDKDVDFVPLVTFIQNSHYTINEQSGGNAGRGTHNEALNR